MKIAFLGLGEMGRRMAQRLLGAGRDVTVWNRSEGAAGPLVAAGAKRAASPREAAQAADAVFAMLADDDASRAVWAEALPGLRQGTLAVEMSTLTPRWSQEWHGLVRARGGAALDAPVVGSLPVAEAGQLVALVGGDGAALERAQPALAAMTSAVHHVGAAGAGAVLKLAVNALFGIQIAAFGELLGLTHAWGLDDAKVLGVLADMQATSPALKGAIKLTSEGKFAPLFPIRLVAKDFRYAVESAQGTALPVTASAAKAYAQARDEGLRDENINAVVKLYRK